MRRLTSNRPDRTGTDNELRDPPVRVVNRVRIYRRALPGSVPLKLVCIPRGLPAFDRFAQAPRTARPRPGIQVPDGCIVAMLLRRPHKGARRDAYGLRENPYGSGHHSPLP
jgi:hypothetical protein